MSALFTSSANQRTKNLIEFKAGKMILQGKTVKPDKRKGLLYAYQSDDTLMHLCWKDRTSGVVEDDFMIFPDDIEYKKLTQCTTGRVFLVRFKTSNKKLFYWMQDPEAEKDDKNWRKLNDCLNNPPAPGSSMSAERSASALSSAFGGDLSGNDLQSLLGSMNEQQIQQLLGISGLMPANSQSTSNASSSQSSRAPSTTSSSRTTSVPAAATTAPPPTTATTTTTIPSEQGKESKSSANTTASATPQIPSASQRIQLSDLQNILGSLNTPGTSIHVDLAEVVTLDVMAPILTNKQVQERLIQYLPEGDVLPKNETELRNTFTTPQFRRAMYSFGEALQSGQIGPLMQQFNLPSEVSNAATKGDIEEFAKAMQNHMRDMKKTKKSNEDEEKMDTVDDATPRI